MGREIGAAVLGYFVMFVIVFVALSLLYVVLGPEGSFQTGSFDVSGSWVTGSIVVGLLAAIAGGWCCAAVARRDGTPKVLALAVFVLGILMAIPVLAGGGEAMIREGEVAMMDAFSQARQPGWVALLNPVLGAIGVLIGARLK